MVGPPSCQLWHPGQPPLPALTQLQAEGISASLSFSVWSWSTLHSDVTQLSKLLQQGPLGPPGAAVKGGTVRLLKVPPFYVLFVHTSMSDLFAQRPFLFLKHFEKPWLNEALALPAPENYPLHLANTPPNRSSVSWAPNCGPKALIPNPSHGSNSQMMDLPVPLRSWA